MWMNTKIDKKQMLVLKLYKNVIFAMEKKKIHVPHE